MKTWKNYGQTMVSFTSDEQKLLRNRLQDLIENRWFKEYSEEKIEKVLFEEFPELKDMNIYLAKAYSLGTTFTFHPIKGEVVSGVKRLYHVTSNKELVMKEGLKGFNYSNDGIRYNSNRIYFSIESFSSKKFIEDSGYMSNRDELYVDLDKCNIYLDPEYNSESGMVYINIDSIPPSKITFTGYRI